MGTLKTVFSNMRDIQNYGRKFLVGYHQAPLTSKRSRRFCGVASTKLRESAIYENKFNVEQKNFELICSVNLGGKKDDTGFRGRLTKIERNISILSCRIITQRAESNGRGHRRLRKPRKL